MTRKNVTETKAQLSSLLEAVEKGEEFIITRGSRPIARIVPFLPSQVERKAGRLKGRIRISPDFEHCSPEIEELFS